MEEGTGLPKPEMPTYAPDFHESVRESEIIHNDFVELVAEDKRFRAKVFIIKLKYADVTRRPDFIAFGVEVVNNDATEPSYAIEGVEKDPYNSNLFLANARGLTFIVNWRKIRGELLLRTQRHGCLVARCTARWLRPCGVPPSTVDRESVLLVG